MAPAPAALELTVSAMVVPQKKNKASPAGSMSTAPALEAVVVSAMAVVMEKTSLAGSMWTPLAPEAVAASATIVAKRAP